MMAGVIVRSQKELDKALADPDVTGVVIDSWFGPQTPQLVALIERIRVLTAAEARKLETHPNRSLSDSPFVFLEHLRLHQTEGWVSLWDEANKALKYAREVAEVNEGFSIHPSAVISRTIMSLFYRDQIGRSGYFTQDHYDAFTRPWRQIIGPIHPDDAQIPS